MNTKIRPLLMASAALSLCLSSHAWAAAADAPAATGVEEIVVTARKTSEKIEDVPLAISAYNVQELASRGLSGLKDIAEHTPGFVFQTYSSTFDSSPTIRGLSQFGRHLVAGQCLHRRQWRLYPPQLFGGSGCRRRRSD